MRTSVRLFGAAAVTAGLMAVGSPAFAGGGGDGINLFNDNNVSILPVQACGNNVAIGGIVAPIASPQHVQCVNAPIIDHD